MLLPIPAKPLLCIQHTSHRTAPWCRPHDAKMRPRRSDGSLTWNASICLVQRRSSLDFSEWSCGHLQQPNACWRNSARFLCNKQHGSSYVIVLLAECTWQPCIDRLNTVGFENWRQSYIYIGACESYKKLRLSTNRPRSKWFEKKSGDSLRNIMMRHKTIISLPTSCLQTLTKSTTNL